MKRRARGLVGPPVTASNRYVFDRLLENCMECAHCGCMSHFKAAERKRGSLQTNVNGRVLAVRRAMYMAAFPGKRILKDRRITSSCANPNCIEPSRLMQATAGQIVQADYEKGYRDKAAVVVHLMRYSRKNNLKLSEVSVRKIREDERTGKFAAAEYGVTPEYFNRIKRGECRIGRNPFAGLMA